MTSKGEISAQLGKSKIEKVTDAIHKVHDAAEIGKSIAPPGVRGRIQDAEDIAEIAEQAVGFFDKFKGLFGHKK